MSDLDVLKAIEEMERCLNADHRSLDPRSIREWQMRFQKAVASAERGTAWARIVQKAQAIQEILEQALIQMVANRNAARCEVEGQTLRQKTLKAHRPGRS